MIDRMLVVTVLLAALALLPSANGITLAVSSDTGGFTENIGADMNERFDGLTTMANTGFSNSVVGRGNLAESHSVSNNGGASALVSVDIGNAARYSYSYNLVPGEGGGWDVSSVKASESLDIKDADYARAYSQAHFGQDDIGVSTEVTKGSLLGYSNQATASADMLTASQRFNSASGNQVLANSWSTVNNNLEASVNTKVQGYANANVKRSITGITGYTDSVSKPPTSASTAIQQNGHIKGTFSSTAKAGTASKTRISNYGTEYDLNMQARADGDSPVVTGTLGYFVDINNPSASKIQGAVDASGPGDIINVAAGSYKENVNIQKSLTVLGKGADKTIVDGQGMGSVFTIGSKENRNVDVTLSKLGIRGGRGNVYEEYYMALEGSFWAGGGVLNYGRLTAMDDKISSNKDAGICNIAGNVIIKSGSISNNIGNGIHNLGSVDIYGGSIDHNSDLGIKNVYGRVRMYDGSIDHNTGHGIQNYFDGGITHMYGGSIDHNTGDGITLGMAPSIMDGGSIHDNDGVGVRNDQYGTFTMNGGSIYCNKDGGIYNLMANLNINGGSIHHNTAAYGGGIRNVIGQLNVNGGSIYGNTADYGGGIYNDDVMYLNGGSIYGNTANYGGGIYNGRTLDLNAGSVDHNTAAIDGGGVYNGPFSTIGGTGNPSVIVHDNMLLDGTPDDISP